VYCAQAVFAGGCDYCLIVQAYVRGTNMSTSAANDLFRQRAGELFSIGIHTGHYSETWLHGPQVYAALMAKYMRDHGAPRELLGMVAVNNRQWASQNPAAALREPFTMDDYLRARMIREPLGLLDLDLPVDAAEAMVLTTAERARDLPNKPVYIHAMSLGGNEIGEYYENVLGWNRTAPWVAMERLWPRSEITVADIDLFYPYDGFTPIVINWTEAAGFAGPGEAWGLFQNSWDDREQKLKLHGRTRLSTGGGSLSHGRAGGFNYYTEAVRQLRGDAGSRQVDGAKTALFGIGSYFHDPAAVIFKTD
jgi:acetyl-CoA acetyltransferase